MRWLRLLLLVLLLPLALLVWLMTTESGLRLVYQQAEPYLPAGLSLGSLQGTLIGPITLAEVEFQQHGMTIKAEHISADWHPGALLAANIDIDSVRIRSLNIVLSDTPPTDQPAILPEIFLPWRTVIKDAQIDGFHFSQNEQTINLKQIRLNASTLLSKVDIKELSISTEDFSLNIKGELLPTHDYHHELAMNWQVKLPSGASIDGNGQLIGNVQTTHLKQQLRSPWQLSLDAEVNDLLDQINWQLVVNAKDINPGILWPEWFGQLQAKLNITGRLENGQLLADADITQLTGELRGFPVSLQSRLNWRDNGIDITLLDFHSGEARVNAKGRVAEVLKLDWSVTTNNLAELHPQAQGRFHANGQLSGSSESPIIEATIKAQALALSNHHIGSLDAKMSLDLFRWQSLDINLNAQTLELAGYPWQSLDISTAGQQIEIRAVSEKLTALAKLQGKTDAQGWHGSLEKVELSNQQLYHWQLKAPASLDVAENTIQAEPICLLNKNSEVCIKLQRQGKHWQAKLDAMEIPLMQFSPWLPADLKIEGQLNTSAELHFIAPNQLLGQGKIELPSGTVSYPLLEGERDLWSYRGGTMVFAMDEQGINSSAEIAMSNGDHFDFKAELPGAQLLTLNYPQQRLLADAHLSVHDLGLIEALLPEVQDLKGEIALNLSAGGTLAQPLVSSDVQLLNGSLRIPRLGLNITKLVLNGQSQGLDKFGFQLNAHSGDGDLTIKGQTILNSADGWPTEISIKGSEFEVAAIPEARIVVTPDLQIEQKKRSIKVRGNINIPQAKLQPKDITTAARASEDAVIIGGEKIAEEKWLLDTRIRLALGERVHFYGFGFEGRLSGNVLLEDKPGYLTKATGEISIPEGRYRAYGQRLEIELGRLLFTGGSPSNPGLDMRAVRHVGNITAGIKVRGSLKQPRLELFSTPAMGQTDTLAYLLLGAPIENASGEEGAMMAKAALAMGLASGDHLARTIGDRFGLDEMRVESSDEGDQASLVVGRYLSPRLYVSYGVGLVEAFNTLTLRYKISNKWQIKAESGEYQGADILYTIER
ncbi:MAG: translocation/assembly module TamB domain-containing protein [Gammaproteobacteria bacterium]|nr:translocation/assembly module TamB domain-containing protein [Gammaproteobacteria bacterium]